MNARELSLVHVPGTNGTPYLFGRGLTRLPISVRDFHIMATPVTQALWAHVMGSNPAVRPDLRCPVENVSWHHIRQPGGFLDRFVFLRIRARFVEWFNPCVNSCVFSRRRTAYFVRRSKPGELHNAVVSQCPSDRTDTFARLDGVSSQRDMEAMCGLARNRDGHSDAAGLRFTIVSGTVFLYVPRRIWILAQECIH